MAYVDSDELEKYLGSQITADYDEIAAVAEIASQAVDSHCQRTFTVPTVATSRSFVPGGSQLLKVHDIAVVTDLVIVDNGATLAASDYQLEVSPGEVNATSVSGRVRPYVYIRRLNGCWWTNCDGEATIDVTARWGWPSTPPEVPLAVKLLAKDFFQMRDTRFGFVQVGDFSRRIADNGVVAGLLSDLRRVETIGIA